MTVAKRIDVPLAALAQRLARKHGHRASEIYAFGEPMVGRIAFEQIEWLLGEVVDLADTRMSFKEATELLARVSQEKKEWR